MKLRDDQVLWSYNPGNQWSNPVGACVLPANEQFTPGDLVHYYDRPDCLGLVAARFQREVEYSGLSTFTKEHAKDNFVGKAMMTHYTVVWNRGVVRTAAECHAHQLRKVGGGPQAAEPG
jgi:hypothetical protein